MLEKGKIGVHQFTILTILFTVGSSILIAPSGVAHEAKQDAWIASAAGLIGGLLLIWLYNRITVRFPRSTFVSCCRQVLGHWLGSAVALFYFGYFFLLAAFVLRNISDFMATQVLTQTPIQFIHIFFLGVVIMGIRNGIETLARTAEIFLPWVFFFFLIMAVLLPPKFEFGNVVPILEYGLKPIIRASLPVLSTPYMELIVFLLIFPSVKNAAMARKAFWVGTLVGGILLVGISLLSILVLGADLTARHVYPSFSLAKKISIGTFLERLEVIMAGIWFITIYFKLSICLYASTMTFAEVFKLRDPKPLYWPFGMLLIALSVTVYPNITYSTQFASRIDFPYSLPYAVLIPALILIVALVRGQKDHKPLRR